jgi:arginyl-tRNA synthetase
MSNIQQTLQQELAKGLKALFQIDVTEIVLQETKKEFEGAYTLVVFPYTKQAGKAPAVIATDLGEYLMANCGIVKAFQVVQGFLNISMPLIS